MSRDADFNHAVSITKQLKDKLELRFETFHTLSGKKWSIPEELREVYEEAGINLKHVQFTSLGADIAMYNNRKEMSLNKIN